MKYPPAVLMDRGSHQKRPHGVAELGKGRIVDKSDLSRVRIPDQKLVVAIGKARAAPATVGIAVKIKRFPLVPQVRGNVINPSGIRRRKRQNDELVTLVSIRECVGVRNAQIPLPSSLNSMGRNAAR